MSEPTDVASASMLTGEVAREGVKMLAPFHRETKLALGMLALVIVSAWYVADIAIPKALKIINEGHAARDAAHSKDLDKVIASFKESLTESQKHNRELVDAIREHQRPIAVNPLGAGS
jgi:hypothetical protein